MDSLQNINGTINETAKYTMEELGVHQSRANLIQLISNAPKAGIIHIHAYEAKSNHGEIADYYYLKGISYENMLNKSLNLLQKIADDKDFSVKVTRGVWVDGEGNYHTRKAKDRTYKVITKTYDHNDEVVGQAIQKIEQSISNPRQSTVEYDKLGNGIYELNDTLHIRDCHLIHKNVIREGDYPKKASGEIVAVEKAIKKSLPLSKYRQVRLDGRFDYIAIGGQLVMQTEDGSNVYVGFGEHKGMVEPRIAGMDTLIEQKKTEKETRKARERIVSLLD